MCKRIAVSMFALALVLVPATFAHAQAKSGSVTITNIRGSGNSVIVDGDGPAKVFTNDRGKGNRVVVIRNGKVISPEKFTFKGKDNPFWTKKQMHAELGFMLYWSPKAQFWFRYHADRDVYLPAVELVEFEARRLEREALDSVDRILRELDQD